MKHECLLIISFYFFILFRAAGISIKQGVAGTKTKEKVIGEKHEIKTILSINFLSKLGKICHYKSLHDFSSRTSQYGSGLSCPVGGSLKSHGILERREPGFESLGRPSLLSYDPAQVMTAVLTSVCSSVKEGCNEKGCRVLLWD